MAVKKKGGAHRPTAGSSSGPCALATKLLPSVASPPCLLHPVFVVFDDFFGVI